MREPTAQELSALEGCVAEQLAPFLTFSNASLYFSPRDLPGAELLPKERCLLVPVSWGRRQLAHLRLDGVKTRECRRLLAIMPQLVSLCLGNVIASSRRHRDESTGFFTELPFLRFLAEKMHPAEDSPLHERCFALLILAWQGTDSVRQRAGGHTVERAFAQMAEQLRLLLPPDSSAALLGSGEWRREFAIFLPGYGRGASHGLAMRLMEALQSLHVIDPFSGATIPLTFSAGHALFPQDLGGADFHADAFSQALLLKDRAHLACQAAWHRGTPALAYAWMLARGGLILENLAHGAVRVNLGSDARSRVGMRFQFFSPGTPQASKGQIVLRQVTSSDALGEVLFLAVADQPPEPGDYLRIISNQEHPPADADLTREDFVKQILASNARCARFAVSLTRFQAPDGGHTDLKPLLDRWLDSGTNIPGEPGVTSWGTYGKDGLLIFWEGLTGEDAAGKILPLHELAQTLGLTAVSGISPYPFLDYTRADWEAGCLKALEYGQLLPPPHVGTLDAVALTISADKCFSQGDKLAAVEEYRRALLLKPDDAMILNSLGVALGALHRWTDAHRCFTTALKGAADVGLRSKIFYNLAHLHQKANELHEARHCYRRCLRLDPKHIYAWLRLGQIEEMAGKIAGARALYSRARAMAGDDNRLTGLAQRFLGRLEAGASGVAKARELLYDALLRNPADTSAMLLLAEAYLSEDAPMAEMLARKSLRLGGSGYDILARALEAQGRYEEARLARGRI